LVLARSLCVQEAEVTMKHAHDPLVLPVAGRLARGTLPQRAQLLLGPLPFAGEIRHLTLQT